MSKFKELHLELKRNIQRLMNSNSPLFSERNMNVLFVCRGNLQRSPTAEDLLTELAGNEIEVKSAGVNRTARTRVDRDLLEWADRIYVMMEGIRQRIEEGFPGSLNEKTIRVLGIPDRYRKGEPRLLKRLIHEFSQDDFLSRYVEEEDLERFEKESEGGFFDRFF